MSVFKSVFLILLASAAAVTLAQAQTPRAGTETPTDPSAASSPHQQHATAQGAKTDESVMTLASKDAANPQSFVNKAAEDGLTEVALGKMALDKSRDARVRKFGERMVQDHGKANKELAAIAKGKNLDVPRQLDAKHQSMLQELSGKSGAAFDAAYVESMSKDHDEAIALFEAAAQSTDPELAAFAKKTMPTLQEHKRLADALLASSRSAGAAGNPPGRR